MAVYHGISYIKYKDMWQLSVGIIEDEAIIALDLKNILQAIGCNILFVAHTPSAARNHLNNFKPDLLLIDINLGLHQNGIDLASSLPEGTHHIFITSYSDVASIERATKTTPIAYITKPYKQADVIAAICIFNNKYRTSHFAINQNSSTESLIIQVKGEKRKIFIDTITHIESYGNYVKIYLLSKEYILQKNTIKNLLNSLNPDKFVRVHRKLILNITKVDKLSFQKVYFGNLSFAIGRNYLKNVKYHFNKNVNSNSYSK